MSAATVIRVQTADPNKKEYQPNRTNLYFTVLIVNVGVFALGSLYSWTSPAIPKLRAKDSWLKINTNEASWIGSLIAFGSIFGPFLGGWLVDNVGRRPTMVLAVAIGIMSWAVLYIAKDVWEIYVSRIVGGVGGGIIFSAVPIYVGEIAEDEVRSALSSLFNFFFTAGMLLEYIVGPYVSYWNLILVSSVAPVIFFLTSSCIPESPFFHLQQDREIKAYNNMIWLRKGAPNELVVEEVKTIKESMEEAAKSKGKFLDLFHTRGTRRAMLLSCGCVVFQQLSGINVVLFYSQMIFEMAGQSRLGPSESTILVGVILLVAAAAAVPLTHRFGIKTMLLFSGLGMSFFLGLMGLYFYLLDEGYETSNYSWLPIMSLIGYVIVYSFGFGPLPWAVMAEVFPPNVKAIASAFTSSCCWAAGFILTKLFPILAEELGTDVVFWSFAVCSVLAFFFVLIILPDTRGMSLLEIQDLLNGVAPQYQTETPDISIMKSQENDSRRSVVSSSMAVVN